MRAELYENPQLLTKEEYRKLGKDDLMDLCVALGEDAVKFYMETEKKTKKVKHYPRIKVWDPEKNDYVSKADKSRPANVKVQPLSFMEIKYKVVEKYIPTALPAKTKKAEAKPASEDLFAAAKARVEKAKAKAAEAKPVAKK
ncbi:MAG: hypothetical protein IKT32_02165 [Clostridia bacterium]|nr:hypothetical protein [Clostridia bacterium]